MAATISATSTTTTTTTATTASGRVPILPPTQSPVRPSTSGFKAPRGGRRPWGGRGSGRGGGRGGRTDIWMEKDPRIQYARSTRTEEDVDEDRDFDEWRTDPEMRFVHERCMARREKKKEKEREEKEKARKEKEEKERKERDGWIEEYGNRPGGAEERE